MINYIFHPVIGIPVRICKTVGMIRKKPQRKNSIVKQYARNALILGWKDKKKN
jgi:hypothetical protein